MKAVVLIASIILTLGLSRANKEVDLKELKCLVCRSTMEEVKAHLEKIDSKEKIEVGNRLDGQGNIMRKEIPMSQSEIYISGVLEDICTKMDDYIRARSKTDGKLMIFKIMTPSGTMNPLMSETNVIQDSDLNKSLKYLCEETLGDYEELIIEAFSKRKPNTIEEVCTTQTNICKVELPSDEITKDDEESEIERVEL